MGGRPKLSKAQRAAAKAAEDAEAWRAETEAALILRDDPAPPLPSWPEAVATFGASAVEALDVTHPNELANACASATALRLFLSVPAAGVLPWRHRAQESLETSLQRLALDDDLQADVKSYRAATLAAGRSAAPPQLQPLEPLAALDGLLLALWGVGRRRREKLAHPVGVMEVAAAVAFGLASVSERCRSLLRAAPAEVRQSWGVREEWVRGDAPAKTPWRKGGCSLLRLLRARWVADLSDAALESFRGSRVAYIGEWGSGMTGTRHLHDALSEPASWALEAHVPLPNFAKLRIALYLFRRRDPDARSAQQAAPHQAGGKRKRRDAAESIVGCDVCGSRQRRLWRCPWSRQLLVCGEGCYAAAEQRHTATLALCFCGAAPTLRPPFALFEAAAWLERSQASDRQSRS
ncbi:hypothetical protein EMIHUDRAFT_240255 [Emiliania huxleyi CCMP1516]|uniref:Uncharacterized protein n=2 Tax=Emiliania huxleyi TaxID=2903 RepID=A0A0D3JG53_EMIH1|nr:hypothetical protein EMIHUDRAFT_240255 [Emiliania huxleyi CCMP1516]EOD22488.1 hypothetical protein EMIHUDRAFT_240255 [Emiliania huxleyi CCMP1516]|eukprot:XP_005774917.1 hypothetical protein EMIHUDRAFT_240255 [Emiliania huxleyi CCMP1516]